MTLEQELDTIASLGEVSTRDCLALLADSIKNEKLDVERRKSSLKDYEMFLRHAEERFKMGKSGAETPFPELRKFYGDYSFKLS